MGTPVKADRMARFYEMASVPETMLSELVQRVAEGEGLAGICASWDVRYGQVWEWLVSDVERYRMFQGALEAGAHFEVEEAKAIADGSEPETLGVDRLRVDVRFRRAKAHAPKVYGEKMEVGVVADAFGELLRRVSERHLKRLKDGQSGPTEKVVGESDAE